MALVPLLLLTVVSTAVSEGLDKRIVDVADILPDLSSDEYGDFDRSMFDPIDAAGCGQRPLLLNNGVDELTTGSSRIVGGDVAVPYSWPAICSLRTTVQPDSHLCGANLIKNLTGQYFLITAAHCVTGQLPTRYTAQCGVHYVSAGVSQPNRVVLTFSALHINPDFDAWTLDYDVAIFELAQQPPTNVYIQPICIPNEGWNEGELAIVSGWGTTSDGGGFPYELHQVVKPIKSRETCRDRYGAAAITDRMMCAGFPEGGKDTCQGDSGGPLATYRENRWTLTGIVSLGYGCGVAGRPGVYTDVISVKAWIGDIINVTP